MITIIGAVSVDGFIGKENKIPWRLKSDMDHFKKVTTEHPGVNTVVMGRKTWNSLGSKFRPLPDRRNIVVTRQPHFQADGAEIIRSPEEILVLAEDNEHIFIMGGEEIYRQTLPLAERLIITRVQKTIGDGDARFPAIERQNWNLVSKIKGIRGEKDECDFEIEKYSPNLPFIEMVNVRTFEQLKIMRRIRQAGHCPFCPENLHLYHKRPILRRGVHWLLTENQWRYPGTGIHFVLIAKKHAESMHHLPREAAAELFSIVEKLELEGKFLGGGMAMRFGDPILSGATIKHLHAQIISPKRGSDPVKFYIGTDQR